MAIYIITAVRFRDDGEVTQVRWARASSNATNAFPGRGHEVDVARVIEAFDHGDIVEMRFETAKGTVSGGQLLRKTLPDGSQGIREDRAAAGRTLKDLPQF
jgi:hypothetical protein